MSIGILTFHRGPNYGGFLQAWHMREAIRSLGHDATLINYQAPAHHQAEQMNFPAPRPSAIKGFILHALKSQPFRKPVSELSDHPFTTDPEKIDWQRFSTVVVGADIVWNFTNKYFGSDPAFYGALPCQKDTRFVAYAPSCGDADVEGPLPDHVTEGLNRFSEFHVRDQTTAELVRKVTGKVADLVVDPTWLQDDPDVTCKSIPRDLKYILVYGEGATGNRAKVLATYAKKHGLAVVSAAFPCEATTHMLYKIDPFEWVNLFRRAEAVVTSTFHGLLYTIKYNKPLLFMARPASRSKSKLAIERCGIADRVVEEEQPFTQAFLDHCLTQAGGCEVPEDWRAQSLGLLRRSLAEYKQNGSTSRALAITDS